MTKRLVVIAAVVAAVAVAPTGAAAPTFTEITCTVNESLHAPPSTLPHYRLTIRVLKGLHEVSGGVAVRFTPERATDRIVFRLWPNAPFLSSKGARLTVGNVTLGGVATRSARPNPTTLVVRRSVPASETVVVSMTFRLLLPSGSFDRLYGGSVARLGSFFPLLAWNPSEGWQTDPPSAIGWEAWTSPSADFDVMVTAPRGLQVLASGEQVGSGHWRAHAVRDFALAVGRFTLVRGTAAAPGRVRLLVGIERGKRSSARRFLGWARAALETYATRYGPYPWKTFTLVGMDMDHFSFEYPTLVFQSTTAPTRGGTAHEVGHQWFYSLVGNNQARDPWLDEALATWAQVRFSNTLGDVIASPVPEPVRNQLGQPMRFWDDFAISVFIDGVYTQGVQALASLGERELVDCALRQYVLTNAYAIASPRDLLSALEAFFPDARQKLEAYGARF